MFPSPGTTPSELMVVSPPQKKPTASQPCSRMGQAAYAGLALSALMAPGRAGDRFRFSKNPPCAPKPCALKRHDGQRDGTEPAGTGRQNQNRDSRRRRSPLWCGSPGCAMRCKTLRNGTKLLAARSLPRAGDAGILRGRTASRADRRADGTAGRKRREALQDDAPRCPGAFRAGSRPAAVGNARLEAAWGASRFLRECRRLDACFSGTWPVGCGNRHGK